VVAFVLSRHDQKDPGKITGPGTYMGSAAPAAPVGVPSDAPPPPIVPLLK
jgi:hypothetical protein